MPFARARPTFRDAVLHAAFHARGHVVGVFSEDRQPARPVSFTSVLMMAARVHVCSKLNFQRRHVHLNVVVHRVFRQTVVQLRRGVQRERIGMALRGRGLQVGQFAALGGIFEARRTLVGARRFRAAVGALRGLAVGPRGAGRLHVDLHRVGAPAWAARHDPRKPDVLPIDAVVNHDERTEAQTRGSEKEAKNQVQRVIQRDGQGPKHPQSDI